MANYKFLLCDSPSTLTPFESLTEIGNLRDATQRQYQLMRNRAGTASFTLRLDDPMAYKILDNVNLNDVRGTVRKCIVIMRDGIALWSGPIWGINGDLPAGTIQVSCVGWLETIQKRILWQTADYSNGGAGTRSDTIAFGLIEKVNAQNPTHPLLIKPGLSIGGMEPRNRFYVLGQPLGPALQELSDVEAGYSYVVDPLTRELNLYAWNYYATRPEIVLGYNWGPNNIQNFNWQEDAGQTCNFMGIVSQGAPVYVSNTTSQDEYGLFEEYNTITGANQDVLIPYGVAELVVRSRPLLTYTLNPFPKSAGNQKMPALFDDYQIGDEIFFTAHKDALRIENQAIRIFGATVQLDDVGNETVTALQTAPSAPGNDTILTPSSGI